MEAMAALPVMFAVGCTTCASLAQAKATFSTGSLHLLIFLCYCTGCASTVRGTMMNLGFWGSFSFPVSQSQASLHRYCGMGSPRWR